MHQSLVDNKHQLPFKDILEPLHPLHGGIGFTPISNTSNRATLLVQATNYLKPNISKHNRDIIHSCVFVNENTILEATPQRKKYNGNNRITDENKKKTSIYVSKFPILNIMIEKINRWRV
jgi:hypothetical protein